MVLRDASAYNVQFDRGRPILIDALSFERWRRGEPWVAYRQFCEHFLAPLALMAQRDVRCGLMLRDFVDGIPLGLAARLLPTSSRFRLGLGTHIHLHARAQHGAASAARGRDAKSATLSPARFEALVDSLRSTVDRLSWRPTGTVWTDYETTTSYTATAADSKARLVDALLRRATGATVWDLGANTGRYSRLAAETGRWVLALDADAGAAERHYLDLRSAGDDRVLPLVVDLANPSPALGWAGRERRSITERANADILLALALVHHIAIGGNVPLPSLSAFLAQLGRQLIIEFVPKSDPRVAGMLAHRRDVFAGYSLDGFRAAFGEHWKALDERPIEDSERVLFLFRRRADQLRGGAG